MSMRIQTLPRTFRRHALGALLLLLALGNLAHYELPNEPSCQCSGYFGRMELSKAYISLREGGADSATARFPEPADWSFGLLPSEEIVESLNAFELGATLELELTAIERFSAPPTPGAFFEAYDGFGYLSGPADRTHLEITATPFDSDSSPETRLLTIVGVLPYLEATAVVWDLGKGLPLQYLRVYFDVLSRQSWSFEIDVDDAPSIESVGPVSPYFPPGVPSVPNQQEGFFATLILSDSVVWDIARRRLDCCYETVCMIREPIHITASEGGRVLRRTVLTDIVARLDRNTGRCPDI